MVGTCSKELSGMGVGGWRGVVGEEWIPSFLSCGLGGADGV